MSIETLLEAARYLEWQAQQQQITREEEQRREKSLLSHDAEQKLYPPVIHPLAWGEDNRLKPHQHHQQLPPKPVAPLPPPVPITVIPIPMVSANPVQPSLQNPSILHTASSVPVLRPLPSDLSPKPHLLNTKDGHSPPQQQHQNLLAQGKVEAYSLPSSNTSPNQQQPPTLLQMFPAPIITAQQPPQQQHQALLPQPAQCQPQTSPVHFQAQVQCQAPAQVQGEAPQLSLTNGATLEDLRNLEAKRRPGGAGTREVHNKLEKNRRAHLKECFETLKRNVPNVDEKKTSNLSVLRSALRYIQTLKRKEKEYEHEMERLAREKIATQQRLAELKNELSQAIDVLEINRILRQTVQPDDDQASTSTASEGEDNFNQDAEDNLSSPPSSSSAPKPPLPVPPEPRAAILPPTILSQHISIQHKPTVAPMPTTTAPHIIAPAPPQPTVITHASVIHAGPKHLAHIAPSTASPIGHITVHPVTHLPTAIYQQPVGVGHITHALAHHQHAHGQVNGMPSPSQQTAVVGKPTTVLAHHHHTGLVGQTVLNPVTMVTVPQFPVGTLKLA